MSVIDSSEVPYIIVIYASCIVGLIWAMVQASAVFAVKLPKSDEEKNNNEKDDLMESLKATDMEKIAVT